MKKIEFIYILFFVLILMMSIFIGKKNFAKNNPANENSSFEKREMANIPFPTSEIISANRINRGKSIPTNDLKKLNDYLNTLKGIKVTEKNIVIDEIDYELKTSGATYKFALAYKKTTPYLYSNNEIWEIDLILLDSFF